MNRRHAAILVTFAPLIWACLECPAEGIKVTPAADDRIDVTAAGRPFTSLIFRKDESKPYLYPVIGPAGNPVTRDWPMRDNPIEKDNNRQDHRHHRSIWCAHGDVRTPNFDGVANYWHETEPAEQDRQVVRRIVRTTSGPDAGLIEVEIDWITRTGVRQFTERRTYTFSADADHHIIDVANRFQFTDTDVTFGDTKEGGLLSIRMAVTMDEHGIETPRRMHGQMINALGQTGEKDCWGQPAAWCDYTGPVFRDDPTEANIVGIAVFDHPNNFRHPTRWHIRAYGLYTANPFGWSHFTGDKANDGSYTWKKGQTAEFNYRILIHKGNISAAQMARHWQTYANLRGPAASQPQTQPAKSR